MFMWPPVYTVQLYSWDPQLPPPPTFGLIYQGAIGQPRYTTSLWNPLCRKDSDAVPMYVWWLRAATWKNQVILHNILFIVKINFSNFGIKLGNAGLIREQRYRIEPWCWNADAGLRQLTTGRNADVGITFLRHSGIHFPLPAVWTCTGFPFHHHQQQLF